jgi:hypothetical protein
MESNILSNKPLATVNNEQIVDLTYPSVRYNYDPFVVGIIPMNSQLEMRPDLLSRVGYGNEQFWDLVLKFNGVSNPFSIAADDVFLMPSLEDMREQLSPPGVQNVIADSVRKQYIDTSKKSKQDPKLEQIEKKRREAQRKKAEGVGVQSVSNLPPNIAEQGDREIVVKGGKVFFGPDISKNKQECEVPLSKSEFLTKLIKNRLNG